MTTMKTMTNKTTVDDDNDNDDKHHQNAILDPVHAMANPYNPAAKAKNSPEPRA